MFITTFSIFTSILWLNVFMVIIILLSRRIKLIKYFSLRGMFFLIALCIVRAFLPLEFLPAIEVNSRVIMVAICSFWSIVLISFDTFNITVLNAVVGVSLFVSALLLIRFLIKYTKVNRAVHYMNEVVDEKILTTARQLKNKLNISKEIKLVSCDYISSPMIVGLSKPIIILPEISFSDEELKGILIHEMAHYKYKHIIFLNIVEFINIIFWWNPIVYMFKKEVSKLIEFHADKKVCSFLDKEEQKSYLQAIIEVTKNNTDGFESSDCSVCLAEKNSDVTLTQRFKMIMDNEYTYKGFGFNTVFATVSVLLVLTSYLFVFQPYSEPDYDDMNDGALEIGADYYIIKHKDNYTIYNGEGEALATREYPIPDYLDYINIYEDE